jgi:hypothetical protein
MQGGLDVANSVRQVTYLIFCEQLLVPVVSQFIKASDKICSVFRGTRGAFLAFLEN